MNMYAAHKTTYTHLECKSIPIDDILQRLWIKTTAEECLSVYQQCDRDMRCKEQKEGDPSISLKRQHDFVLLVPSHSLRTCIRQKSSMEKREGNVTWTVTVGDVTHSEVILFVV